MAQIPPLGRGEVSVQGGEAPRSQTTSMKTSTTGCCSWAVCVWDATVPGLAC